MAGLQDIDVVRPAARPRPQLRVLHVASAPHASRITLTPFPRGRIAQFHGAARADAMTAG
jgi:hypothetical protein